MRIVKIALTIPFIALILHFRCSCFMFSAISFRRSDLDSFLCLKFNFFKSFFAGALVYRLFRGERKKKLKLLHMSTMLTALVLTIIALKAAFDSHDLHKVKLI